MSVIEFKNHNEEFDRSYPLCDVIKVDGQLYVHISKVEVFQNQLQQKENIIKEVREWAKKYSCQFTNDDGELVVSEISFNIQARPCDLFKILDKENKHDD